MEIDTYEKSCHEDTHIGHVVDDPLDEGLAHCYSVILGVELEEEGMVAVAALWRAMAIVAASDPVFYGPAVR